MKRILILFAHPAYHKSRINKKLIEAVENIDGITITHLYEKYPDFFIDVKKEQQLLKAHEIIVWHHPFYWYSAPALIKEWMDLVLEHGYAYGKHGNALAGKLVFSVISSGGKKEVYSKDGRNHYTINQFLVPFRQSANLCQMQYLPPFVVHGSHTISQEQLQEYTQKYRELLLGLRDEKINLNELCSKEYANDLNSKNV